MKSFSVLLFLLAASPSWAAEPEMVNGLELKQAVSAWITPGSYEGDHCAVEIREADNYFIVGLYHDPGPAVYLSANMHTSFRDISLAKACDTLTVESEMKEEYENDESSTWVDRIRLKKLPATNQYLVTGYHSYTRSSGDNERDSYSVSCRIDLQAAP